MLDHEINRHRDPARAVAKEPAPPSGRDQQASAVTRRPRHARRPDRETPESESASGSDMDFRCRVRDLGVPSALCPSEVSKAASESSNKAPTIGALRFPE